MRPFDYLRATDVETAASAAGHGALPLAGGTTLLDLMKLDVLKPSRIVDVNELSNAHGDVTLERDALSLGAFARMAQVARHADVAREFPVIASSLLLAASPQIRNMATLGGNVLQRTRCPYFRDKGWHCNKRTPGTGCAALETDKTRRHALLGTSDACIAAYPGDFAQALVALRAEVEVVGPAGPRRFPFAELHRLPERTPHLETTLVPGEIIVRFLVPTGAWTRRSTYVKIRDRASYEFAVTSAAVALALGDGARVTEARIALGGVATVPWRAAAAEDDLRGRAVNEETARAAAELAFDGARRHGENGFKIELGKRTLVRALLEVAAMEVGT